MNFFRVESPSQNYVDMDKVIVIATSNRPEAIDRALRRPGRFDREIEVGVPTPKQRREILDAHLKTVKHELSDAAAEELSKNTHGFVGADVAALVQAAAMNALRRRVKEKEGIEKEFGKEMLEKALAAEERKKRASCGCARCVAAIEAWRREKADGDAVGALTSDLERASLDDDGVPMLAPLHITDADFLDARTKIRPSAMREVQIEVPNVGWDDVGGLEEVKQRIKEAVEWSEKFPEAMARMGAVPPKGILLYGPPGCSKTLLAKAVASQSGRNFLTVKGGELYSKWVGDSEKAVRTLFTSAKTNAPSVIFLDELDGLVGKRGMDDGTESGGGPSVSDRVLTMMLTMMDGVGSLGDGVAVVAATNRPDLVDPALLRPGRFDRLIYIPPPDKAEDRTAILRVLLKKTPLDDDVDLDALGLACAGYTGADLTAVVRESGLAALEESLEATKVSARHFTEGFGRVPPSPPPSEEMRAMYESFKRGGGGPPSKSASGGP